MLELLISILMSLGIHFTMLDGGQVSMSSQDRAALESSTMYHESGADKASDQIVVNDGIDPAYDIVVNDGIDPNAKASSHE